MKGARKGARKKAAPAATRKKAAGVTRRSRTRSARADFGAPVEGFFARQPPPLRAILDELRALVEEAAPEAESSLKWGMPFYTVRGTMMCALGAHRSHVNLILSGPPGAFSDPGGALSGEGKTGRHLKLTRVDELPRDAVRGWLRTAAELARGER